MAIQNVICLVVDRLHIGFFGAYGNTWVRTPSLDRLAAESFVFDRAGIDSPELALQYRSLWMGMHVLCPSEMATRRMSLPAALSQLGKQTVLVTDSADVGEQQLAASFDQRIMVVPLLAGGQMRTRTVASSSDETDAAGFFASAIEWITSASAPFFLWLHTETLGRVWDAPLSFREQYTDEDDPAPREGADVPNKTVPEDFDPDELLGIRNAYAGQVTLLDEMIGSLLDSLAAAGLEKQTLFILYSPRGFPLGEHRRIGPADEALYSDLSHVPLLMRFPAEMRGVGRSTSLVQPADVAATILDACGLPIVETSAGIGRSTLPLVRGERQTRFDRAYAIGPSGQLRIVTPAWSLRLSEVTLRPDRSDDSNAAPQAGPPHVELFAKPDDWFELNEVSDLCPEIAEKMQTEFEQFAEACKAGQQAIATRQPDELATGLY